LKQIHCTSTAEFSTACCKEKTFKGITYFWIHMFMCTETSISIWW